MKLLLPVAYALVPPTSFLEAKPSSALPLGEESANFQLSKETPQSWAAFGGAVSVVLGGLYVLWIRPDTGYCDDFLSLFAEPHVGTVVIGSIFASTHSGLAALRPSAEKIVGPRAWRVVFALASLPLAYAWILYWIEHRYDGLVLWECPTNGLLWAANYISFFFLYPSTFNLKEVAAVDKPELHLWGTGVARITRHPQAFGQFLWSTAHAATMGTSVTLLTMIMLVGHHAFSIWHGDRRLKEKYGDEFEELKKTTSIVPFAAILDGRQQLPPDYITEWQRGPYALIAVATLAAYFAHPYMQAGAALAQNTGLVPGGILNN